MDGAAADTASVETISDGQVPATRRVTGVAWVPTHYAVPTSPVVRQWGRVRLHRSGVRTLVVSTVLVGLAVVGAGSAGPATTVLAGLGLALAWASTVSFVHHEAAHALMARRFGVRTRDVGFHGNGAYVRFRPTAEPVPGRAWAWIMAAGPLSNALVGVLLLWLAASRTDGPFLATFCLAAGAIELGWALRTGIPRRSNDGRALVDAWRSSRV